MFSTFDFGKQNLPAEFKARSCAKSRLAFSPSHFGVVFHKLSLVLLIKARKFGAAKNAVANRFIEVLSF